MKRLKGSITIYLFVILSIFLLLETSLFDVLRLKSAVDNAKVLAVYEAENAGNVYDKEIFDRYGLTFLDSAVDLSGEVSSRLAASKFDYFGIDTSAKLGYMMPYTMLSRIDGRLDAEYLKNNTRHIASLDREYSELEAFDKSIDTIGACKDRILGNIDVVQRQSPEGSYFTYNNVCHSSSGNAVGITRFDDIVPSGVGTLTTDMIETYNNRFSNHYSSRDEDNVWLFYHRNKESYTDMGSELGIASLDMRLQYQWDTAYKKDEFMYVISDTNFKNDMGVLGWYAEKYLGNALNQSSDTWIRAGMEYICFGMEEDRKNIELALERMYQYRWVVRLTDSLARGEVYDEATVIAASDKALSDVRTMYSGGMVELYEGSTKQVGYIDYLRYMFLHEDGPNIMYARLADVIELNTGKCLGQTLYAADMQLFVSLQYDPCSVIGIFGVYNRLTCNVRIGGAR